MVDEGGDVPQLFDVLLVKQGQEVKEVGRACTFNKLQATFFFPGQYEICSSSLNAY
jgi:hypothetical protein